MRRLELVDGKSPKFWEVDVEGKVVKTHWGRLGAPSGQRQAKKLGSEQAALALAEKQVKEKLAKGYKEVGRKQPNKPKKKNENDDVARVAALLEGYGRVPPADRWEADSDLEKVAGRVVRSGDVAAQQRLLDLVKKHAKVRGVGAVGLALVGARDLGPSAKRGASPKIQKALAPMVELAEAGGDLWRAATYAIILTDPAHLAERLARVLDPKKLMSEATMVRADEVLRAVAIAGADRDPRFVDSVVPLLFPPAPAVARAAFWKRRVWSVRNWVFGYLREKGREKALARILCHEEIEEETLRRLFQGVRFEDGAVRGREIAAAKRMMPALTRVARELRASGDDAAREKRIAVVDEALGVEGALVSEAPKQLPKAPPKLKLKACPRYADGGPVVAVPTESVWAWHGAPTKDYDRACDATNKGVGFLSVDGRQALSLPDPCDWVMLPDGKCLLVLQGDEEEVAAIPPNAKWQRQKQVLDLASGKLVVFDAVWTAAESRKKSVTLKLAPGRHAVEVLRYHRGKLELWLVRLSPTP